MNLLKKKVLGGTGVALSMLLLSACGSESTPAASVDTSAALKERIAGLEKKLTEQGIKSDEQAQKIAALEKKLNELGTVSVTGKGTGGKTVVNIGNNGSAGKGDGVLITFAQYEQLEVGMTLENVIDILGGEGEALSEAENMVVYNYKGVAGNGGNAVIAFQGGKLLTKAQSGLE